MKKAKRIFLIADFKDEEPKSIRIQPRMWAKGLTRLGCDVQRFSYRNIMMQASLLPCKKFAQRFAKQKTDYLLIEQLKSFHPDIVLIIGFKYLDEETILKARQAAPGATFVSREEDPNPEKYPHRQAIAKQTDILIATSAGRFLETYKNAGVKMCAFIPNMCDPDIQYRYAADEKWRTDIIFTGKIEHTRLCREDLRYKIVEKLNAMQNAKVYGASKTQKVDGIDYLYAISGAKIGLSINIVNDERLYHSDRLTNYISCGTFTLAKRVPDTDLLFKDKIHLRYFDTADEFFELADWYLKHDSEREKIAQTGIEHAHKEFNCTKIAGYMMDLIEKGNYQTPWKVIL